MTTKMTLKRFLEVERKKSVRRKWVMKMNKGHRPRVKH